MRTVWAIVGVLALVAASAAGAEERLVLEPYPGPPWHEVMNQTQGGRFIRELLPADQTPDTLRDVLTAQSVPGSPDPPGQFLAALFQQYADQCENIETKGPTEVVEQGRQVAYAQLYCGRLKGQTTGAHIFYKAIRGTDALYVVDRDFRTPGSDHAAAPAFTKAQDAIAFLEAESVASRYLKQQVYLCDPVFPDPRCPTTAGAPGR